MRISQLTRFPHPVLSNDTHDYLNSEFSVQLEVKRQIACALAPSVAHAVVVPTTKWEVN